MKNHHDVTKLSNGPRKLSSQFSNINHLETETEDTSDQEHDKTPQGNISEGETQSETSECLEDINARICQ